MQGQKAKKFQVMARGSEGGAFALLGNGSSIARKRIVVFQGGAVMTGTIRLRVTESYEWPVVIRQLAAFAPCTRPEGGSIV